MRIDYNIHLDYSDVLLQPKRSTLNSRRDVDILRKFKFLMKEYSFIKFIPNSITLMSLIAGISSIKFSIQGNWKLSVLMIMLAAFFDFFDGWMARKLKKSSQFGAELDSLSDFISFGLAPSLLLNLCYTHELGRIGWTFSLFYIVCAALRLARFNIENTREQSKTFIGMPSPAAAGIVMIPFSAASKIDLIK